MVRLQLAQAMRHPADPVRVLTRLRGRDRRQYGGSKPGQIHPLECIRIGEHAGDRHEPRRFHVDEFARDPLAPRHPQGRDHSLARIDRHKTIAGLYFGVSIFRFGVDLYNDRDGWKLFDRLLDVFLKRGRQRHGHTVVRPR